MSDAAAEKSPLTTDRKDCPACRHIHPQETSQCAQCGVIFAKWKDPKQKEAEVKLAALAAESSQGFPRWILLILALAIGLPLLVIFVPDVETRVRGGKLKYRLPVGHNLNHRGSFSVSMTGPVGPDGAQLPSTVTLDDLTVTLDSLIRVLDTDSGGNSSLRQSYPRLSLEPSLSSSGVLEKDAQTLALWTKNWTIGGRGTVITMTMDAAQSMKAAAQTMMRHNQLRAEQAREKSWAYSGLEPEEAAPAPPQDPYVEILNSLNPGDILSVDMAAALIYPKERVKPGASWEENLTVSAKSKLIALSASQPVPFRLQSFERRAGGFCAILGWDAPVRPDLRSNVGPLQASLPSAAVQASYAGEAGVDYATGVLEWLDGKIDVLITIPAEKAGAVCQSLNVPVPDSYSPVTFRLQGRQKVTRL